MPDLLSEPSAEQILKLTKPGEDAHESRRRRYDHAYEVYRPPVPKRRGPDDWGSKLRVKYGMQVVDTALVNIVGGPPKAKVKPRRPEDQTTAPKMGEVLAYHVGEDHLVEQLPTFVQQALIYGVALAKNDWLYRETTRSFRRFVLNPMQPGVPVGLEDTQRVVLRDGPHFQPWDVYDAWWEPNARAVDDAGYIVLRSWMTKTEVLQNTAGEQNPYGLFDPAAVAAMFKDGVTGSRDRTTAQERSLGASQVKRKDRFEILEIWRETAAGLFQTIIGGRTVILRNRPTPFWHGKKPIVAASVRPDGFEFAGISETELLDDLQQALQTLMNMRMDNLHLTVNRGFTYRESGILNPRDLVVKPRFMWGVTDHDDVQAVEVQPLPSEAYKEDEILLGRMQLVTGISPYISGADMSGVDQSTATGVTALQDVASRLLRFKARRIAYSGVQRTFEQWGELVQQFMSHEQAVRIEGPDGYDWSSVSPQEIVGNYDYGVEGIEESLSKQQERGDATTMLNAAAGLLQVQGFNIEPILQKFAVAFDLPPGALYQKPAVPPPGAPGPGGQQQALPPGAELPGNQTPFGQHQNGQQMSPQIVQQMLQGG
jgi:hypothetical protein